MITAGDDYAGRLGLRLGLLAGQGGVRSEREGLRPALLICTAAPSSPRQARKLCPTDPLTSNELGVLAYRNRQYDAAVQYLQVALDLVPGHLTTGGSVGGRRAAPGAWRAGSVAGWLAGWGPPSNWYSSGVDQAEAHMHMCAW